MVYKPLTKDEQRLLVAFFKANFDAANYWDGYCDGLRERKSLAKTLDELDADQEIKLAIKLDLLDPKWIGDLKYHLAEMMKLEKKKK